MTTTHPNAITTAGELAHEAHLATEGSVWGELTADITEKYVASPDGGRCAYISGPERGDDGELIFTWTGHEMVNDGHRYVYEPITDARTGTAADLLPAIIDFIR